ncbi:g13056 [Coccomyxa viridis]|uniref:G13056 protein n=1 Tax=Coccomyxa viridis TaxID=1274662 RepID=A0ABP1GCX2_9CHLO
MTALTFARFGGVVCAAQPRKVAKAKVGRVSAGGNGASIADLARENGSSNGALSSSHTESFPESSDKELDQDQKASVSRINYIPKSRWPKGIPPVMGAHLMPSGEVAPISTSKGAGVGGVPHKFMYPKEDKENYQVMQFASQAAGSQGLAMYVQQISEAAIKERGAFTLVLSGGSLLKAVGQLVGAPGVDFSKWHVFFVDERNVPHSHPDSNFKGADEALLSKAPIPREQIHAIKEKLPVAEAATEYAGQLLRLDETVLPRNSEGLPVFDAMLLGLGPDGHVASLFPNRSQLAATDSWVLPVENSPKPPPERITFSLPVINSAKEIAIVAMGEGKAEIVQRVLEVQSLPGALPAQLVQPSNGSLKWFLDIASAQNLSMHKWDSTKDFPRST